MKTLITPLLLAIAALLAGPLKAQDTVSQSTPAPAANTATSIPATKLIPSMPTGAWTLQQCIAYAIEHNLEVKQQNLNTKAQEIAHKSAKFAALPGISAGISDGFNFGRTQGSSGLYTAQNSNNASVGADLNIPIFQGLKISESSKRSRQDWLASIEDENKIRQDIQLNLCSKFLQVLLYKELLRVSREQLALTNELEQRMASLVTNGKEPQTKLYELRAQKANELYQVTNADRDLRMGLLELAQMLELEQSANFDIIEPQEGLNLNDMSIPIVLFEESVKIMPQIRAENYRLESAKHSLKEAQSNYYPSLSLSAGLNTGYYHYFNAASAGAMLEDNSFGKQLGDNFRSYVSVSLQIPIFNRMSVKHQVQTQRLQIEKQNVQIEQVKKALFKDIQRAYLNVQSSKERFQAANLSAEANEESFDFTQKSYEAGRSTTFELQQAKTSLEKSQSEKIQAKYEFLFNLKVLEYYNGKEL